MFEQNYRTVSPTAFLKSFHLSGIFLLFDSSLSDFDCSSTSKVKREAETEGGH